MYIIAIKHTLMKTKPLKKKSLIFDKKTRVKISKFERMIKLFLKSQKNDFLKIFKKFIF